MRTLRWCLSASFPKAGCKLVSLNGVSPILLMSRRLRYLLPGLPGWHFKVKFQNFGFFKSGLAWKNGVWHVRHSLAFFGLFWWCLHEKTLFGTFVKSLVKLLLSDFVIKRFIWGQRPSLFCHGPILEDTSGFAV